MHLEPGVSNTTSRRARCVSRMAELTTVECRRSSFRRWMGAKHGYLMRTKAKRGCLREGEAQLSPIAPASGRPAFLLVPSVLAVLVRPAVPLLRAGVKRRGRGLVVLASGCERQRTNPPSLEGLYRLGPSEAQKPAVIFALPQSDVVLLSSRPLVLKGRRRRSFRFR